ncbi:MAG: HAD family hydrolase [Elusimicrobia bacterium]|nr:HAD family hydrolase [Elusimicrobiota bacterium]
MLVYSRKSDNKTKKPAVFLDRDGTINLDRKGRYLTKTSGIRIYKTAPDALIKLQESGFQLIILTNQSAVARKLMTLKKAILVNLKILDYLEKKGVKIDGIYMCPHGPRDGCRCRKPEPGLVKEALKNHNLDIKSSYLVGDKTTDMILARKFNLKSILLLTGHGSHEIKAAKNLAAHVADTLLQAARWIIKQQ